MTYKAIDIICIICYANRNLGLRHWIFNIIAPYLNSPAFSNFYSTLGPSKVDKSKSSLPFAEATYPRDRPTLYIREKKTNFNNTFYCFPAPWSLIAH